MISFKWATTLAVLLALTIVKDAAGNQKVGHVRRRVRRSSSNSANSNSAHRNSAHNVESDLAIAHEHTPNHLAHPVQEAVVADTTTHGDDNSGEHSPNHLAHPVEEAVVADTTTQGDDNSAVHTPGHLAHPIVTDTGADGEDTEAEHTPNHLAHPVEEGVVVADTDGGNELQNEIESTPDADVLNSVLVLSVLEQATLSSSVDFQNYAWDNLPEGIQNAASILGYNETTWDNNQVIAVDNMEWAQLGDARQNAATLLGYTQETWDEEEANNINVEYGDYENLDWDELHEAAREAAEKLGYDSESWDKDELIAIDFLGWDELESEQQEAAKTLGYTEEAWCSS